MTLKGELPTRAPRVSHAGASALLLDVSGHKFCLATQQRLWALTAPDSPLRAQPWVKECVLGVNNVLLIYDALVVEHLDAQVLLLQSWETSLPWEEAGVTHEVLVTYDLSDGGDLAAIASTAGYSREEALQMHSAAEYRVACVGSMPGFAYLVGLPERLATPRRGSPRPAMPKGAVIIGGTQAGIMPCTAPSGWHMLGTTDAEMFDPQRPQPSLLAPGDRVVFRRREVSP